MEATPTVLYFVNIYMYMYSRLGQFVSKIGNWKKIQFVVKSFHQKKLVVHFFKFFLHKWHADLHGFANFCKLPVAHTLKVMQTKILKYFKFCYIMYCKKCADRCENYSFFKNCAKMQKIIKNSKILKNDGHFRIPHPQIS